MKKGLWMLAALLGASALGWVLVGSDPAAASNRIWPGDASVVMPPHFVVPVDYGTRKIYLDAGHGAEGNTGNLSSRCQDEQDFTRALAHHLAPLLEATGVFEVTLSRSGNELVGYRDRVAHAEAIGADVFVSLHSDVRGEDDGEGIERDGRRCPRSRSAPGFSVLWSDHGDEALNLRRLALARTMSRRLMQMGVMPYDGDYRGLYARDTDVPGVFVDRHAEGERIFVLHKPRMPSIIIETHNAWDDREAARWEDPALRDAFGAALIAALLEVLR